MTNRAAMKLLGLLLPACATGDDCAAPCRESTCGEMITLSLSCADTEALGCSCGGCCDSTCATTRCRGKTCGALSHSFTCSEMESVLECPQCGTCCNATFASPPPSPLAPNATLGEELGLVCTELPSWGAPLGIVFGVFGSIGINVGQNMQADGIQGLPEEFRETAPFKSVAWCWGMGFFVGFSMLNFAALGFAPASVLVPLESIQFVTNVFYSKIVHKKDVPPRMIIGVALACLGTVLTVVFGASGDSYAADGS